MLPLRALSMEKVVTEDLSPDSYPQTLLEEIQTLKKFYIILLNQQSCRKKRYLLNQRWSQDTIDASIDVFQIYMKIKMQRTDFEIEEMIEECIDVSKYAMKQKISEQ